MNSLLLEYKKKYEDDEVDYLEMPYKEFAEAWLDAHIAYRKKIEKLKSRYGIDNDLCFGDLLKDKGEFECEIVVGMGCESVCNGYNPYMQIYQGIQYLAKILGLQLYKKEFSLEESRWEYYFDYKGIKIMQLSNSDFDAILGGDNDG